MNLKRALLSMSTLPNAVTQKAAIRVSMKESLHSLKTEYIAEKSEDVLRQLTQLPFWERVQKVSIFLSMAKEVQTLPMLAALFKSNKIVLIPKVTGPRAEDMQMFVIHSIDEISSFPLTKWGIPEPPIETVLARVEESENIDMIIAPGCAFDTKCNRLGHGKGYYDSFLRRYFEKASLRGKEAPVTVGICFDEQLIPEVPVSSHDIALNYVVTPSSIYRNS